MKTITAKNLKMQDLQDAFGHSVYEGIEYAKTFYLEYPKKPIRPILKDRHTVEDLEVYTKEYKTYTDKMVLYNREKDEYTDKNNKVNDVIEEFIKYAAHLDGVPEQYRNKVWDKAWSEGHSAGYSEVYICLLNLVEIFMD